MRALASVGFVVAAAVPALLLFACGATAVAPSVASVPSVSTAVAMGEAGVAAATGLVHVQILAINDFHGNLEPPAGSGGYISAKIDDPLLASLGPDAGIRSNKDAGTALVPTGGAVYLASTLRRLRAENPNTVIVSAGDLTGASPLVSNLFNDDPTILVMNEIGLDFEAVGNHDFDRGLGALERLQRGDGAFPGAKFQYLAANVRTAASAATVFPPFAIRELQGVKIAFVGMTLQGTPTVTVASAVKGLNFDPEIETVNRLVPELKKQGVAAIVAVVHQGGAQAWSGTYDSCDGFSGALARLLEVHVDGGSAPLDPAVDVVVSGHTHQAYDCLIDGRIVTSAASYGRLVTKIDLTIDPVARRIVEKHAHNIPVTRDVPPDPAVGRIVDRYVQDTAPLTSRSVGYISSDFVGDVKVVSNPSCETPLGDLIADGQLAATRSLGHPSPRDAQIAFMNPGGLRSDLLARRPGRPPSAVSYADAFEVQPFGNELVTMTLTGDQIRALLAEQFGLDRVRILLPSEGFSYAYAYDRAARQAVIDPHSIRLHGVPLDPLTSYRVTVNSFLAAGGDGFKVLEQGTDRVLGAKDIDAFTSYLAKASSPKAPLSPPRIHRISGDACR